MTPPEEREVGDWSSQVIREEPSRLRNWAQSLARHWPAQVLVVAILYSAVATLSLRLAFANTNASPVWPPSGIALAAVLLFGYRAWLGITLGAVLANIITFVGNQAGDIGAIAAVSAVIGIGNTLEALVGRWLLDRCGGASCLFTRPQDVFRFTAMALLASLVSAGIGPTAISLAGLAPSAGYGTIWFTWWLGDAAAILLVAPFLITWSLQPRPNWAPRQRIEAGLLLVSLAVVMYVVFGGWLLHPEGHYPLTFVPLPWLVWAAFRFGPREAATAAVVTSGIAVWLTSNGLGPFSAVTVNESLLLLQAFIGVVTVTILTMAAVVAEGRDARARLRTAHDTLETQVEQRTRVLWGVNERLQAEIEERRRVEEVLRESESRYRLLADNVSDLIFVYDLRLRPLYISPSVTRLRGYSVEEAMAQPLSERLTPASAAVAMQALADAVAHPHGPPHPVTLELELTRKDGTTVWTETKMSFVRDAQWQPTAIIGVARDITERKRAEAQRATLEGQLLQHRKLEAVGRLAAGIAHDFNNLLTIIGGRSQLALMQLARTDSVRPHLELIRTATNRAARVVQQLLAFSRKQILRPAVLDLNTVIEDMLDMLRQLIGEDIELAFNAAPALNRVRADVSQLEQVILNLAANARDAMPDGGQWTIETANVVVDDHDPERPLGVPAGAYVRLTVNDTGVGMTEATRARLFEPFFTTKPVAQGTGLGLATVYGIVQQSAGHITVDSELGRGTTFTIYLPQAHGSLEIGEEGPEAAASRGGTETVLLVEDEEDVRNVTREILESLGYTVLVASRPREAMRIADQHPGPIHLMLTDVVMPETNGRRLAVHVTSRRHDMKVLYMSGYTNDAIVHHGVVEPGIRLLHKPFSRQRLADTVREVLDETPGRVGG